MSVKYKNGKLAFTQQVGPAIPQVAGRFAVRAGDGHLLLGAGWGGLLRPGHVYEIRRGLLDDALRLHDVGPSVVGMDAQDPNGVPDVYWAHTPEHILEVGGGVHLVTQEEWAALHGVDTKHNKPA